MEIEKDNIDSLIDFVLRYDIQSRADGSIEYEKSTLLVILISTAPPLNQLHICYLKQTLLHSSLVPH